ncbi:thioredoxin-disulfide reductase [Thermodesulfobacterium geofontis]|uniref:thioredoxin-disulfide reductase n=1 Tax=Thermodesulfobacterium geofontis TaxID=1295609 RepID=UPI00117FB6D9|nr:thioredoxin-disulfide reductase [Thermodesulfobacterium geofontis]
MKLYDLVIVGAGPAGITAYLYAKRSLLEVLLVDKIGIGGQLLLIDFVENYPGFPEGITGFELADLFRRHIETLGLNFKQGEVKKLEKKDNFFNLYLDNNEILTSKTVLLSIGASPRKLNIPGEKKFTGKGVSYCATCDGPFFKDKIIAVVGGGDTALQESLSLTKFAKKIYLIHRRNTFRATKVLQERVFKEEKIEILWNTIVTEIRGKDQVEEIEIFNKEKGEKSTLKVSGIFIFIGYEPNTDWLKGVIELDNEGFIITDAEMRTSLPGVWAAGDCRSKVGKQIVIACGEGAVAVISIENYLQSIGI